jgi:hypothetical protein
VLPNDLLLKRGHHAVPAHGADNSVS